MKPNRLNVDPNTPDASKAYKHWLRTFTNFAAKFEADADSDKLELLINFVESNVFDYISDCETFADALSTLQSVYIKPKNVIFARHLLATRKQKTGESLDQYLNELKLLSKDCDFTAVTAEQYCSELIRDAFINGLTSSSIRQRLLENKSLDLSTAYDQARSLEVAQLSSNVYGGTQSDIVSAACSSEITSNAPVAAAQVSKKQSCWFCGKDRHPRTRCPACEANCNKCNRPF